MAALPSSEKEAAPSKMASYGNGAENGGGHLGGARGQAVFSLRFINMRSFKMFKFHSLFECLY